MNSLVKLWRAEHRSFGALLGLLAEQLDLLAKGEAPNYEIMLDILDYMVDYADRFHHPAEDLVFAKVAERVPSARESVSDLMRQHIELVKIGRQLIGALEAAVHGTVTPRSTIEAQGSQYLDAFRRHMYAEEQGVFLTALEQLSSEDWNSIHREARRGEDPLFGERPQQRYAALRREISGTSDDSTR